MSDNKKYYYLRLKENFFDSDEIVLLESMPEGHVYSNILLKLYLKSLKQEGKLMFNNRIPFSPTMLATITRHPVGVVEKAISIFADLELIDMLDNGAIYMLDIQNFIGKTSTEAERKKAYRAQIKAEKQSLLEQGQMSGHLSDVRPPELEIELEKDIKLKKELQLQPQEEKNNGVWSSFSTYQKLWLFPNDIQRESLIELINTYSDELVNVAIILAGKNDVPKNRSLNFVESCLTEWANANVKTVDEARTYTVNRKKMNRQSYQKNTRVEKLPDWAANPDETSQITEEDPAVKAELERRLAAYERGKAARDGA